MKNYNFRNQDVFAEMYGQYDQPEYLSSTDSVVVGMRRLFTEHARGVTPSDPEVVAQELGEVMVRENDLKTLGDCAGDLRRADQRRYEGSGVVLSPAL